jgi:transcriptional regulator with XRE-family HTH domain
MNRRASSKATNSIDSAVGHRIRLARLAKGWSQIELGDGCGLSYQQIQKYETGVNRVGAGRLQQIAELLDTTTSALFEEPTTETAKVEAMADTSSARRMLLAIKKMNPTERHLFVELAELITSRRKTP